MATLRLILGDQLSKEISSLEGIDAVNDLIVMMEIRPETNYVAHHKRKIAFIFSAMRHFAKSLAEDFKVKYFTFDSLDNHHDFLKNLESLLKKQKFSKCVVTEAAEYRLLKQLKMDLPKLKIPFEIRSDHRFLCSKPEFQNFVSNQPSLKMETFYRYMRKKSGLLMTDSGKPLGGKWNYDHQNRSPFKGEREIPRRLKFTPDKITQDVLNLVEENFKDNFGDLKNFYEPVTRSQALESFHYFLKHHLPHFGQYQDAMQENQNFMFHSRLSHLINCGLLNPKEICNEIIKKVDSAPLAAIEGFIRQIIGWREYIRGIYWQRMPDYLQNNFFNHQRSLPAFFWTGSCKMNCVKNVIKATEKTAYSHHIQRLMITGNLALLMELKPIEVHEWYLAVYDDAYEWVELPNTLGMALYADGGVMSTKPYVSSGNYINKMSNFCKNCDYNVKEKIGSNACPFNYLYWNFLDKNRQKLSKNPRLFMAYNNLNKKDQKTLIEIKNSSIEFFDSYDKG